MIDNIIRFAVQQKLVVLLAAFGMIGWGVYSLQQLAVDAVPDITNNQVQIITNTPTLATQEVEQFITAPLERALATLPQKVEMRSISRFGLSSITVVFEEDVDINLARRWVEERLKTVEDIIPASFGKPELAPVTTGLGEIYQYVLYSDSTHDATELRTIQDWLVKRQLSMLPGVIEVNSIGGYLRQYEVAINPERMRDLGVSVQEVLAALEQNNANSGGAYIEKSNYSYFIRAEGLLTSLQDIEKVVVKVVNGVPILVRDIGQARMGAAPRFGAVTMSGHKEVVAGQVLMLKGSNSADVIARVKTKIEDIKQQLPKGVYLDSYLDRSKLVNKTIRTVETNLLEGGLIVILMLVLFLGNLRAGLIVASVIPLAMLFAISMMNVFGISANLMSLGAIDFGLVVDGAVIIVESILHRLHHDHANQRLTQRQMDDLVLDSAIKIRESAAFGEIIILIVYLPILALTGIEGKMFKPMAQTVGFAILGALILSLTYVPMMVALFAQKNISDKLTFADRLINALQSVYRPLLESVLRFKKTVVVGVFALFIGSVALFTRMGGEFIPTLEEGDFAIHQILPVGSSLQKSIEVSTELQNMLTSNFPEIEKIVTKIGTAEIPTDIMPWEGADIFVSLKDQSEWTSGKTREELFAKMEHVLNQFPGVFYEFSQPIQMRFNELMTGVRQDIAIKIYGDDMATLARLGEQARDIVTPVQGVGEIQLERTTGLQQIVIRYNRARMAQYGIDIQTINTTIRTGFAGQPVGFIFEEERRFDLAVRLAPEFRQDIENVRKLYVTAPNGAQIPLEELAEIRYEEAPMQVSRDNARRRIVLGINARGRDVESLVGDLQKELAAKLELPSGYFLEYGGQFENLKNAQKRLSIAVPVALLLILVLLFFTFNSMKQAILIFTAVPMAAIGGIWALWLRDMPFSISAGVGFIALFGVAVLNGIVLIGYFNQLKMSGIEDTMQRILVGTSVRLRPVIMTATVASLGFLPMAISQTAGGEVQRPLATVVIGGLITATFLTLFVLPILYYFTEEGFGGKPPLSATGAAVCLMGVLLVGNMSGLSAQTLPELWKQTAEKHTLVQQAELNVQQYTTLQNGARQHPQMTAYYNHEGWKFRDVADGMHTLYAQQNFNLPIVANTYRAYQGAQADLARLDKKFTQNELRQAISAWYIEVVNAQMRKKFYHYWDSTIYQRWEQLADARYRAGETTKIPLVQAQLQRQEIRVQSQQIEQQTQIALQQLRYFVQNENVVVADNELMPLVTMFDSTYRQKNAESADNHLFVKQAAQRIEIAETKAKNIESQLAPQIYTQFQVQILNKDAPYWGLAGGVTVPIFPQNIKAQTKSAEMQAAVQKQALEWQKQSIENNLNVQRQTLARLELALRRYQTELLPLAQQQLDLAYKAYQAGDTDYLIFLQGTQQLWQQQTAYLDLQREYLLALIHWQYLLAQ